MSGEEADMLGGLRKPLRAFLPTLAYNISDASATVWTDV